MIPIRRDLLGRVLAEGPRQVTLRDIENYLRAMVRDPVDAERKVGSLYGHVFKNKEVRYDAAGGRWLRAEEPS